MSDDPYRKPGIIGRVFEPVLRMEQAKLDSLLLAFGIVSVLLALIAWGLVYSSSGVIAAIKQPSGWIEPEPPCRDSLIDLSSGVGATCPHSNQISYIEPDEDKPTRMRCICVRPCISGASHE
jgi:hypothetical protein